MAPLAVDGPPLPELEVDAAVERLRHRLHGLGWHLPVSYLWKKMPRIVQSLLPQRRYPQCIGCSKNQGLVVAKLALAAKAQKK